MAIVNRNFVYRRRIKVSQSDLDLARTGSKTCTIRLGTIGVDGEQVDLTDGRDVLPVKITAVEPDWKYRDLNDGHAAKEGFSCLQELQDDLKKYYGSIEAEQPITVISFEMR